MRARDPDRDGFADHDGIRIFYEVYGAGEPTLVLVPSNPIVHSRHLSRHYRVVTTATPGGATTAAGGPRERRAPPNGQGPRQGQPPHQGPRRLAGRPLAVTDGTGGW
jgi:hypothetical protein